MSFLFPFFGSLQPILLENPVIALRKSVISSTKIFRTEHNVHQESPWGKRFGWLIGYTYYSKKENFYVCTEYKKTKSNCPVTAKILEEELIITGGAPQPQLCPNNISIDYIFIQYIANRNNLYVLVHFFLYLPVNF